MKACEESVLPVFNRCVIFNTDADSYHGHPLPMTCPEGTFRRSIALYYYTIEENPYPPGHLLPGKAGRWQQ
jgi:hypothetical protein